MHLTLRPIESTDAAVCGTIFFHAFNRLAQRHGFPPDVPSPGSGEERMRMLIADDGFYGVVAEIDGQLVGSSFLDERGMIRAIGPVTVAPDLQGHAVGRTMMEHLLERAERRNAPGVRLCQVAHNRHSMGLYAKLGFRVREPLTAMQGPRPGISVPGLHVRPARPGDLVACNRLCLAVHGHDRSRELECAMRAGTARVVERGNVITAYATGLGYGCHAIAETNAGLEALIGAAETFGGPGILIPSRNAPLLRWCLDHGLLIVQQMNLMSMGLYNEPQGAWMPSVLY